MEDIQMYNFTVKSKIHDYSVDFISNIEDSFSNQLKENDFLIIDKKVYNLFKEKLTTKIDKHRKLLIDATERQKSYQELIPVIDFLIKSGVKKNHRLVAIGGGVTQDVTAFIASILYRGIEWIFYPTTLLAQGDSCIGSKTSINFGEYKNQIGGFYPPNHIFIDTNFLTTLPESEIKSGFGEMCHYFIVSSEADFVFFKKSYKELNENSTVLNSVISRSLGIKKRYAEIDEFDKNERQVFNYGHSFGHAIESLTNYEIPHGIAVAFGMDISNFISVKLGYIDNNVRTEIRNLLCEIWKGYHIAHLSVEKMVNALSKDKKNVGNKFGLILNKGYGKIFKCIIDADEQFISWLSEYLENETK
jgi:3-dehydroquinate synthase